MIYILMGPSGSGKSTFVKKLRQEVDPNLVVVSADDYFTDEKGQYNFDPTQLSSAHRVCFRTFMEHFLRVRLKLSFDKLRALLKRGRLSGPPLGQLVRFEV